jgi:small-conductance mechanosensitive channel
VGIWGVVIAVDGDYEALTGGNLISGAVLLLVAGAITFFVSIIGFCGAVGMWRPFLVIYAVAVIVIVIIEIVGAILAFVFTEEANDEIRDNMIRAIRNYQFNDSSTDYDATTNSAVETAQGFFECCGVDNYTDWITLNPEAIVENSVIIPARCFCDRDQPNCKVGVEIDVMVNGTSYPNTINVWDRGCQTLLEDSLEGTSLINGVIGIVIAIIEISFVVLAFCLCGAVHKHKKNNYA